jgi:L-aminoadipate-semialdehyde dehydrogenase
VSDKCIFQRDIFTPLGLGAQLIIPPADVITYELLAEWMGENRLTVTHLTPAMGQILVGGAVAHIPSLRNAFFVGDLLTKKDCRKLADLAPNTSIINLYGSTESQRAVSYFEIISKAKDPEFLDQLPDIIPIGQGMKNVQLLVVDRDDRNKLCGVGEQGELFIRAAGLSEGYLGDDEKTMKLNQSKFLLNWFVDPHKWAREYGKAASGDNPNPNDRGARDRLYRTGDLGRMRSDGNIECTGRIDSQVKIRGFRIELGEIDITLSQHPYVRENITIVRRDKNEEHTLVTYFVPETKRWFEYLEQEEGDMDVDHENLDESMMGMLKRFKSLSEDCKKFLAAKLPKYAVPTIFIPLARMPLSMYFPVTP